MWLTSCSSFLPKNERKKTNRVFFVDSTTNTYKLYLKEAFSRYVHKSSQIMYFLISVYNEESLNAVFQKHSTENSTPAN